MQWSAGIKLVQINGAVQKTTPFPFACIFVKQLHKAEFSTACVCILSSSRNRLERINTLALLDPVDIHTKDKEKVKMDSSVGNFIPSYRVNKNDESFATKHVKFFKMHCNLCIILTGIIVPKGDHTNFFLHHF